MIKNKFRPQKASVSDLLLCGSVQHAFHTLPRYQIKFGLK